MVLQTDPPINLMNAPASGKISLLATTYLWFAKAASFLQSPLLLIVRLYWGWQFFLTGKGKLENLGRIAEYFASLGIPLPYLNAALAGTTECVGGLLLVLGLGARLVSLPLTFVLIVAYLTADLEAVKTLFTNPENFLTADPFQFLFAVVLVLAFGPGAFSIDALIARRFRSAKTSR